MNMMKFQFELTCKSLQIESLKVSTIKCMKNFNYWTSYELITAKNLWVNNQCVLPVFCPTVGDCKVHHISVLFNPPHKTGGSFVAEWQTIILSLFCSFYQLLWTRYSVCKPFPAETWCLTQWFRSHGTIAPHAEVDENEDSEPILHIFCFHFLLFEN